MVLLKSCLICCIADCLTRLWLKQIIFFNCFEILLQGSFCITQVDPLCFCESLDVNYLLSRQSVVGHLFKQIPRFLLCASDKMEAAD